VLEKGIYAEWHKGRVVLVGDAVAKYSPNLAIGFTNAFESSAALVNQLHRLVMSEGEGKATTAEIESAFRGYVAP